MMSPSVLLEGDEVKLVLGSGGSKRIRTAITQVLSQIIDFNRDISTAVHAPRLHWDGEALQVEPGFSDDSIAELVKRFPVNVWKERNVYFGGVHTVIPGGECVGDPRRGGAVTVVPS
jgi:gamma-glutamyltranspeptidase/glutathione hydrolase